MARTGNRIEFGNGVYTVELTLQPEIEGWQTGSIDPGLQSDEALGQLGDAVLDSLAPVASEEIAYSDCTDGRFRENLDDGIPVPVREKLVGADTMTAFAMAEALGDKFYGSDKATVAERIDEVVDFLAANGFMPSTHGHCGAAGGFVPVSQNIIAFSANANFMRRQAEFVPVHDAGLFDALVRRLGIHLASGAYEGYSDTLVTAAVQKHSAGHAIAHYRDDGTGVNGHNESAIVRLLDIEGVSVDTNRLAAAADGAQVFAINDARIPRLAELFGRGHDADYVTAYMAGEAFTDAGHGTLGNNLRTLIIRPAA